jgi:hypothetical protein
MDKSAYGLLDVKEKTVLDIGAYVGDTAEFFLKRGAKKVICIERDVGRASRIKLPNTVVLAESFKLEHLDIPHDCMKMDIEGYEQMIVGLQGRLKPSIVEVHNWYLYDRFKEMGFTEVTKPLAMLGMCLMRNFEVAD